MNKKNSETQSQPSFELVITDKFKETFSGIPETNKENIMRKTIELFNQAIDAKSLQDLTKGGFHRLTGVPGRWYSYGPDQSRIVAKFEDGKLYVDRCFHTHDDYEKFLNKLRKKETDRGKEDENLKDYLRSYFFKISDAVSRAIPEYMFYIKVEPDKQKDVIAVQTILNNYEIPIIKKEGNKKTFRIIDNVKSDVAKVIRDEIIDDVILTLIERGEDLGFEVSVEGERAEYYNNLKKDKATHMQFYPYYQKFMERLKVQDFMFNLSENIGIETSKPKLKIKLGESYEKMREQACKYLAKMIDLSLHHRSEDRINKLKKQLEKEMEQFVSNLLNTAEVAA